MKVYLLGIGGIGMSALALYFYEKGENVMGYDRTRSSLTKSLEEKGIQINYEDVEDNVPQNIDLCVYTPAIPEDSKQLLYIKKNNITLKKRAVVLGEITRNKKVLAVAGSHGKTTTCGIISNILRNSKCGCSAFLGGILKNTMSNFIYNSNSEIVVVEADEYDRSFLQLYPFVSVITSIAADHLDIYHTYNNLYHTFEEFASHTNKGGLLLLKENIGKDFISKDIPTRIYSLSDETSNYYAYNLRANNGFYYFDYKCENSVLYDMKMIYPGLHNIENSVAALTVCDFVLKSVGLIGKEREKILREGLLSFEGIERRLDFRIRTNDRIFIDDYAHHPQEISSTIQSLRKLYPRKKFTGIFQPHLYSRTRDLSDNFVKALEELDEIILLPIYPAREEPIVGIDSHILFNKMCKKNKYLVTKQQLFPLLGALNPEFLITFGAGDIAELVPEIEKLLNN